MRNVPGLVISFQEKRTYEDGMKCRVYLSLMMDAESTSKPWVSFYHITPCSIPKDSHLYTCHYENLKQHKSVVNPVKELIYTYYYCTFTNICRQCLK